MRTLRDSAVQSNSARPLELGAFVQGDEHVRGRRVRRLKIPVDGRWAGLPGTVLHHLEARGASAAARLVPVLLLRVARGQRLRALLRERLVERHHLEPVSQQERLHDRGIERGAGVQAVEDDDATQIVEAAVPAPKKEAEPTKVY